MASLRNISIRTRLWLLVALSISCVLITQLLALKSIYDGAYKAKEVSVKEQVDTAYSLVLHYYKQFQSGALSEQEAQSLAMNNLRQLRYSGNEYFWINDSELVMLMNAGAPAFEGRSIKDVKDHQGRYLFRDIVQYALSKPEGSLYHYPWPKTAGSEPVDKVSFVKHFAPWDWFVGTGLYTDDVWDSFIDEASISVLMMLLFIIAMTTFAVMLSLSIRLPMDRFLQAMRNVAQGEADLTQRLPTKGDDELSALAGSFNRFMAQLQTLVRATQTTASELSTVSDTISGLSNHTSTLTNDQLAQSDQAATASNEMSLTIQEVAANAERAAAAAQEVDDSARRGLGIMSSAQHSIMELANDIQHSCEVIRGLHTETNAIGSVLDVIRGVAEQTNLLALNAAIEAARAGEQGRGFAVVADEVRTLASRTQQSTAEIHHMIARLQEQAANAVQSMENNVAHSEKTATAANNAMQTIASISSSVSTITEMNLSIASAVEEQSAAANEITGNVVRISESAGRIVGNMHETESSVQKLLEKTQSLLHTMERFEV